MTTFVVSSDDLFPGSTLRSSELTLIMYGCIGAEIILHTHNILILEQIFCPLYSGEALWGSSLEKEGPQIPDPLLELDSSPINWGMHAILHEHLKANTDLSCVFRQSVSTDPGLSTHHAMVC
jgi:hypothetical protein